MEVDYITKTTKDALKAEVNTKLNSPDGWQLLGIYMDGNNYTAWMLKVGKPLVVEDTTYYDSNNSY